MRLRWLYGVAALVLIAGVAIGVTFVVVGSGESDPMVTETITFELSVPPYTVETRSGAELDSTRVAVEGYESRFGVGAPGLPKGGVLVGIPPDATDISLQIIQVDSSISGGLSGETPPAAANSWTPDEVIQVGESGFLRNQAFVRIEVQPVQWNRESRQIKHHSRIQALLTVTAPKKSQAFRPDSSPDSPVFEKILETTLLNYEGARKWRSKPVVNPPDSELARTLQDNPNAEVFKVTVDRDGIYRLTYNEIARAGLQTGNIKPPEIRVFNPWSEIAIEVFTQKRSVFGPNDSFRFYGRKADTRYAEDNVYWVVLGAGDGKRVAVKQGGGTGPPATFYQRLLRLEEDREYRSTLSAGGDHWFWGVINASGSQVASKEFGFDLSMPAALTSLATLRANIIGMPAQDNFDTFRVELFLNEQPVGEIRWGGPVAHTEALTIPADLLRSSGNTIRVEAPRGPGDRAVVLLVNWFELEMSAPATATDEELLFEGDLALHLVAGFTTSDIVVYDISDASAVNRISNTLVRPVPQGFEVEFPAVAVGLRQYLATTGGNTKGPTRIDRVQMAGLIDEENQADYLIITPGEFVPSVQPLAAYHTSRGRRVKVVQVQDIYNEFSGALQDPAAIHSFLSYAVANWQRPAPSYVLLLGDGTFDYRDFMQTGDQNFVPPILADVDPFLGEGSSDNRYATVVGDDTLPDLLIDRLTARTPEEVDGMVAKILRYANSGGGQWTNRVHLVSDNPDLAGDFIAISESVIVALPESAEVVRTYLNDPATETEKVRSAVRDSFDSGALIVNYLGHAAITQWGHENLLSPDDAAVLDNQDRLPVILSMTCYHGLFSAPGISSVSESLVRNPSGGAIAAFAATGLSVATGHELLILGFVNAVYDRQILDLGAAVLLGKLNVFQTTTDYRDLIDTFGLLGDPGLAIKQG